VAEQWRSALGVGVDVVPLGWEAIVERGTGTAGLDGAFRFAWAPTHPSPDAVLRPLFHSGAIGRDNWSRYSSGPFDDSIRDARRAAGAEDRAAAYDRAEAIACDDLPMLPLLRDTKQLFVRDRIASASGRFVDVTYGQPLVRELFVR
jgi:ABC-type oligopeptide transport system substrate-binding subunit